MSQKSKGIFNYLINLTFILYFVILIVERILSVTLTISKEGASALFKNGFNGFTFVLLFVSIVAFLVYYIICSRDSLKLLFSPSQKETLQVNYVNLSIASGILLLSGMVGTPNTISGIQFAAYGLLIVGLLLHTIECAYGSKNLLGLWVSFAYIVCFSMAIPVMHDATNMANAYQAFHAVEGVAMVILVFCFTVLEVMMFKKPDFRLFYVCPILFAIGFDVLLAAWPGLNSGLINWFAIIFLIASVVLYVFGFIQSRLVKQEK